MLLRISLRYNKTFSELEELKFSEIAKLYSAIEYEREKNIEANK